MWRFFFRFLFVHHHQELAAFICIFSKYYYFLHFFSSIFHHRLLLLHRHSKFFEVNIPPKWKKKFWVWIFRVVASSFLHFLPFLVGFTFLPVHRSLPIHCSLFSSIFAFFSSSPSPISLHSYLYRYLHSSSLLPSLICTHFLPFKITRIRRNSHIDIIAICCFIKMCLHCYVAIFVN